LEVIDCSLISQSVGGVKIIKLKLIMKNKTINGFLAFFDWLCQFETLKNKDHQLSNARCQIPIEINE
jgi:hypothetical protein